MRTIKDAEVRKNEILDAANELFGQNGFDGTSTNDILEKVGIARGTLYYHFKSKEEIMDALILRTITHMLSAARKIAEDTTMPVVERIVRVVMALQVSDGQDGSDENTKELTEHMHKPQNALMHLKTQNAILEGVTPILSELVSEGIEQGLFDTPFPYQCIEMVMTYAINAFDDDTPQTTQDERATRIEGFIYNMERLLGAKSGSLMVIMNLFGAQDGGDDAGLK